MLNADETFYILNQHHTGGSLSRPQATEVPQALWTGLHARGLFTEQKAKVKVNFWHRHVDSAEQERQVAPESLRVLDPSSSWSTSASLCLPNPTGQWGTSKKFPVCSSFTLLKVK